MKENKKSTNSNSEKPKTRASNVFKDVFYIPKYTLNIEQIQLMSQDEKKERYNEIKSEIQDYNRKKYLSIRIKGIWIWVIILFALSILCMLISYFLTKLIH
ncbi:hypothetical protein C4M96_04165 [Mycoplasmopsis pullorum]|uniref:hypothetical protein n=1 Tax=Mycoplasmopsis pullorum TaxID=48003 RepID=UPI00111B69C6|nr:hypothetical protein [Mycoplasmopsis pullorum]TNK81887.1 hypothetical protein C4M93_04160 [Mycoplasmopsis pullorum]TNK91469.1 hypothetical protein C4M96_04165 [Mycoplasmopsis pullorum]